MIPLDIKAPKTPVKTDGLENIYNFKLKNLVYLIVCLFVLLLYVPSQQLWSWRDSQFT